MPALEITAEVRLTNHLGLAAIGGIGSVRPPDQSTRFAVQELGGQLVYYPLENFDSLVLGGEVLWLHVSGSVDNDNVKGVGAGTALGPLVGYKWISSAGFTLFAQAGVEHVWMQADATSTTTGQSDHSEKTEWIPLLNFNIGWSF